MKYTFNSIINEKIIICQPKDGYRFAEDSVLLAEFISTSLNSFIVDVGSGSGVISAILAVEYEYSNITAVEYQKEMFDCLVQTIDKCGVGDKVKALHSGIESFKPENRIDLIVCNPPYRNIANGRTSKNMVDKTAKFNDTLNLDILFKFSKSYLKDKGSVCISYPAKMLAEIFEKAFKYKLEPKRMKIVQPAENSGAKIILMELKNNAGREMTIEPVLIQEK